MRPAAPLDIPFTKPNGHVVAKLSNLKALQRAEAAMPADEGLHGNPADLPRHAPIAHQNAIH